MSRVKEFLKEREEQEFMANAEQVVRFSVTLSEKDNRRLEYIASKADLKRAEFARELILLGLGECEEHYGLETVRMGSDDKPEITPYNEVVNGDTDIQQIIERERKGK